VWRPRRRGRSRIATSSSFPTDDYLRAVVATPGLTALRDLDLARAMLWDDALRAAPLVEGLEGPVVDVGSGGGSPGIPVAVALPTRDVTLLDAERRKCDFLQGWAPPNASVVWGRAEEQPRESFGVVLAKGLGKPPVAAEWCLPLARLGGAVILWLGESADLDAVATAAETLGGGPPQDHAGLVLIPKIAPTPEGFPRRVGVAKRRPLA